MKSSLVSLEKKLPMVFREFYIVKEKGYPAKVMQILHPKDPPFLWRVFGYFTAKESFDWTPESTTSEFLTLDEEVWRPVGVAESLAISAAMSRREYR